MLVHVSFPCSAVNLRGITAISEAVKGGKRAIGCITKGAHAPAKANCEHGARHEKNRVEVALFVSQLGNVHVLGDLGYILLEFFMPADKQWGILLIAIGCVVSHRAWKLTLLER